MRILFIHPNMPGQYKHLAAEFAKDSANEVVFITKSRPHINIPNVRKIEYQLSRDPAKETHRYIFGFERGVIQGQEVWRCCRDLKNEGFVPDVICGHFGWGDGLFVKDIFHSTPTLVLHEFYYDPYRGDSATYDPEFGETFSDGDNADDAARIRMKNPLQLMNLADCDWGVTPTWFQLYQHPKEFHSKISVLHEGVDTLNLTPRHAQTLQLSDTVKLTRDDEVVTYISRNFEPYRGFPQFMRAAEKLHKERPNCHIVMVGQDGVSYGKPPPGEKTFRQLMMERVSLDPNRLHFLGYLPHDQMVKVLQFSNAHLYLTVPFVLSWSMLEAMACGVKLVASDTGPVREVCTHEENAVLVNLFDVDAIAAGIARVLDDKKLAEKISQNARQTIENRYALKDLLPLHMQLIRDVAAGTMPPACSNAILQRNPAPTPELLADPDLMRKIES